MYRRLWLAVLVLYAVGVGADLALHLSEHARAGRNWLAPANVAVAVSTSLFWPLDMIAQALLGR